MRTSKPKTKEVAQVSVRNFLWRHPSTYYWTFTVHEILEDKTEALRRAKPLYDLINRRHGLARDVQGTYRERGSYLAFWELQKRGSWHLHLLTSVYLDVNWLRDWMVKRGWGQQMRVELVKVNNSFSYSCADEKNFNTNGPHTSSGANRLANYLTKYLTKSLDDCPGKKAFCCSALARAGTIQFTWLPEVNPYAYFFAWGRVLFYDIYGRGPMFREFRHVMRLGYEDCGWSKIDPWTDPPG